MFFGECVYYMTWHRCTCVICIWFKWRAFSERKYKWNCCREIFRCCCVLLKQTEQPGSSCWVGGQKQKISLTSMHLWAGRTSCHALKKKTNCIHACAYKKKTPYPVKVNIKFCRMVRHGCFESSVSYRASCISECNAMHVWHLIFLFLLYRCCSSLSLTPVGLFFSLPQFLISSHVVDAVAIATPTILICSLSNAVKPIRFAIIFTLSPFFSRTHTHTCTCEANVKWKHRIVKSIHIFLELDTRATVPLSLFSSTNQMLSLTHQHKKKNQACDF